MIDITKSLIDALKTVLPTYYELAVSSGTATPCITYQERNNAAAEQGETIGYSRITYTVKVWGYDIEQLNNYAIQIDAKLKPLGWKRTSVNEMFSYQSGMIQKILTYEALAIETFKGV